MTASVDEAAVLSAVGRRGVADYLFERDGARTALRRASCSSPWHYLPPTYQDETGCAYTWLVNPSGGLVGGDELTVRAALQPNTHVLMTSPSANRVYRSVGEPARQDIHLAVGPGARLEWLPEVTIPFAGSRFTQTLHVTLGERAAAVVWDALASGRIARNERWAFAAVENEIRIATSTGAVVMERYRAEPETIGASLDAWDYVASLFVIADGPDPLVWERLAAELRDIVKDPHGRILGGVSEPAASGVVVKLVARTAPALAAVLEALTSVVRQRLWELPPPVFRRY
jgi:urease accessory protein